MARKKKVDLELLQELTIKSSDSQLYDIQEYRGIYFKGGEQYIVVLAKPKDI